MGRSWNGLAVLTVAGLLALGVGCGVGSDNESASGDVGGPAKKAPSGPPLRIGFVTDVAGPLADPLTEAGAEAGERHVNERLGGVGGRPLEVIRCGTDGSPEKAIDCANKFVEEGVPLVQVGLSIGVDAMLPILKEAGIPLVGHIAGGEKTNTDRNSFFLGAAPAAYTLASLKLYAERGAKRVRYFLADVPSFHQADELLLQPAAKKLGLDYKAIFFRASPQWPVLVATALADDPDVVGSPGAIDQDCLGFISAFRNAGYQGPIFGAGCGLAVRKLGTKAAGVEVYTDSWRTDDIEAAPPAKRRELETFTAAMGGEGSDGAGSVFASFAFADTIDIARILSKVHGKIDGAAVTAAMRATRDYDRFLGPRVRCDHKAIPGTSACGSSVLFYRADDSGKLKLSSDGYVESR
jgi:branched-chain amino acid transport system substrate-binding protein